MSIIHSFSALRKGISDYIPAFRFIFKHHLAWTFFIPLLLNIILFTGMYAVISSFIDYLQSSTLNATGLEDANFWGSDALRWLMSISIGILVQGLFFFLFTYTSGNVILLLLSPILAYISERTDKILTGEEYQFSSLQLFKDIVRGVLIVLRNLFYQTIITVGLFFFVFIPILGQIVGVLSPFILFFVAAYFNGFSFFDYVLERRKLNVKDRILYVKQKKSMVIGNGIPFTLVLFIPFIGLFLVEFFAIIASVAAVISITDSENNFSYKHHE